MFQIITALFNLVKYQKMKNKTAKNILQKDKDKDNITHVLLSFDKKKPLSLKQVSPIDLNFLSLSSLSNKAKETQLRFKKVCFVG